MGALWLREQRDQVPKNSSSWLFIAYLQRNGGEVIIRKSKGTLQKYNLSPFALVVVKRLQNGGGHKDVITDFL